MSDYFDDYFDDISDDFLEDDFSEDNSGSSWAKGYSEGESVGKRNAIYAIAKYLADDWQITSRETLPKIFDFRDDQNELWDDLVLARERKLKYLQSEVKKLERKLDKLKEKNKEKKK